MENNSKSEPTTIHVRHKRHFDLCTIVLPPNSSVRDLKLDLSNKRLWNDVKTKDDIKKITRPGERVPLWERYVFTSKDDGACFIIHPKPDAEELAKKAAERQARLATLPADVVKEIDGLSVLVQRLEQQLSELEDMEIDLIVSSRVKRCALERDDDSSMRYDDNAADLDKLCDYMDSVEQEARDREQLQRIDAEKAQDMDLLGEEHIRLFDVSQSKRAKHTEDPMNID